MKPLISQFNRNAPRMENPNKFKRGASPLHAVPEVVCVEEAIEFGIQVDDIDASLCSIPNNGTGKVASVVVLFSVDAQAAVNTKFQSERCFVSLLASESGQ
jgi:hypothetical protein